MSDRQALHAYLSDDAHKAWQALAEENGVSVTGILEGIGLELAEDIDASGDACDLKPEWIARIRRGRKIDAQRRRRGGS